jgi:hypothetical protein
MIVCSCCVDLKGTIYEVRSTIFPPFVNRKSKIVNPLSPQACNTWADRGTR